VEEIAVLPTMPVNRPWNAERIASLDMRKGEFSAKLAEFVAVLNQHRAVLGTNPDDEERPR
jgi:hypothetical protein